VILELAGIPRNAVRLRLEGRTLIVSGRRVPPQELHGAHYHRAEIYFGTFERALELPWEADPNGIQAHYRDGMLEIRIRSATGGRVKDVPINEGAEPVKPR
jgi:HSP20 family protein